MDLHQQLLNSPSTRESMRISFELVHSPITCIQDIRNLRQFVKNLKKETTLTSFPNMDKSFKSARNFITDQDDDYI